MSSSFFNRRGGRLENDQSEQRARHIEDYLSELEARIANAETPAQQLGGGAAVLSPPVSSPTALDGDVIGMPTANTVVKIRNVPVDTPASPADDLKYLQYNAGALDWASLTAVMLIFPVRTITANDTATTADGVILADTTAGAVTLTLPAAATMTGRVLVVKKISAGDLNLVTIDGSGAETIDNALTAEFSTPYLSLALLSDGSEWYIVMAYIPSAIAQEVTLLASAARTVTTVTSTQTTEVHQGLTLFLNVTVAAAGETLTVRVQYRDPVSGAFTDAFTSTVVNTTGLKIYQIHRGASGASGSAALVLPRRWTVRIQHSGVGSWTYSLGASLAA